MQRFPSFYDPGRIGTLHYPAVAAIADEAARSGLSPAAEDRVRAHLLIIDMQVDFCHERGTLFVPGAGEDIRRLIEFIFRNAGRITAISCTLDSHLPLQIFHPAWWADARGRHPEPFTIIRHEDIRAGHWRPLWEPDWSCRYVEQLQRQSKKELTIWPYHVPIGGVGHALDPELWSAVFWHAIARHSQPTWLTKGSAPLTEHYSALRPEIPVPGQDATEARAAVLRILDQNDCVVLAGEAASHCVLETIEDLLEEFGPGHPALAKLHVLRDCTSPVKHPEIDFAALVRERFDAYQRQGVRFIASTDPPPF
jgi:nicotinamidase-related amidase